MRNTVLKIIRTLMGIALLYAAISLIIGSFQNYAQQHDRKDWIEQTAQVADISSRIESTGAGSHRRSRTVYDITYQYQVDGKIYTGEISGSSTIRMVGDLLKIKYDPEAPENATTTLSPQLSDLLIPLSAGVIFGVLGFFLSGLYGWIRKLRRREEPEEEELLPPEAYADPAQEGQPPRRPWIKVLRRIILPMVVVGMFLVGVSLFSGRDAVSAEQFAQALEARGHTVEDSTAKLREEWRIGSLLEQAVSLQTDKIRIDFCVMDAYSSARILYQGMELPVAEGDEYKDSGANHEIFSVESEEMYTAKLRVGNTVIYAASTPEYRAEVIELLKAIGYLQE